MAENEGRDESGWGGDEDRSLWKMRANENRRHGSSDWNMHYDSRTTCHAAVCAQDDLATVICTSDSSTVIATQQFVRKTI